MLIILCIDFYLVSNFIIGVLFFNYEFYNSVNFFCVGLCFFVRILEDFVNVGVGLFVRWVFMRGEWVVCVD